MPETRLIDDLNEAAALLRAGRLVAIPTETVYGLGGHALDESAVAKIFEAKGRPFFDPLIVHVSCFEDVTPLVENPPRELEALAEAFWPGPLTLVLPKSSRVPDIVTAGLPSVAIRIPDHPIAHELLKTAAIPVAAPSANLFGRVSPTTPEHVLEQLSGRIDAVVKGDPCRVGIESTVLHLTGEGPPTLLRPGGLAVEEIERVIGPVQLPTSDSTLAGPQLAPGRLPQHYAPRTPLKLVASWAKLPADVDSSRTGLLAFRTLPQRSFKATEVLSPSGSLAEAAAQLFAAMRRLDTAGVDVVYAERFPEEGLGRAINDRLRRAAAPPAANH